MKRLCLGAFLCIILAILPLSLAAQTTLGPTAGGTGSHAIPTKVGQIGIWDGTKYAPGDPFITANTPAIVQKAHNNIGGATVKTLSVTVTALAKGNTLVVAVGAGEVVGSNIVLTVTDTNSDACTLAATQAVSTTFAASIYYCPVLTGGDTAVTETFSGTSSVNTTIAAQVWEVSGLITLAPQVLDVTAVGTATSTTLFAGQVLATANNDFAFGAFGVGTGAQTITLTGTGTWNNDSGQINPTSASGLFSFVGASQWLPTEAGASAGGTITSEPWVCVLALFRPVSLPVQNVLSYAPASTSSIAVPVCTSAMTSTTSTVTLAAPAAGLRNYITALIVTNSHATVGTFVSFQDGSGGTILWEGYAGITGGGFTASFPVPLRQTTAGNGLYVADVTTGANVIACAEGFTAP